MKVKFTNVDINLINKKEAMDICRGYFNSSNVNTIYFLNAHCYNVSRKNEKYKIALNNASLLLNDGIGVKLGLAINGLREKENMNGTDLIPEIVKLATDNGKKLYLLGGKPGIAKLAKKNLLERYAGCEIVGVNDGYFTDSNEIVNDIINKKADILIVGMGVPLQEVWIDENKEKLKGVQLIIAGGAILDFISGNVKRAPICIRKLKLEWIYRLIQEPKRLFKRYIIGNFKFLYYIFKFKIYGE